MPKEQGVGGQPKPAPEAALATTERPDVDTVPAPAKQASHKTKQRHVTRQYRNSWDANNRWNSYNRYSQSQWGYARETQQQQWRSW